MKILVSYFSQSGNTEKIAQGIWEEASLFSDADLKKLEDVRIETLIEYDALFIGSPLHAGSLATPVKEFLSRIKPDSIQCMAGFITHFAPAYPEQSMQGFTEPIQAVCAKNHIEYKGSFDCQGALTESLHKIVQKKQNLTDEQWNDMVNQMTGHPNAEDVANAKAFVRDLLS